MIAGLAWYIVRSIPAVPSCDFPGINLPTHRILNRYTIHPQLLNGLDFVSAFSDSIVRTKLHWHIRFYKPVFPLIHWIPALVYISDASKFVFVFSDGIKTT